jgi:phage gp46-like protein
VRKTTKIFTQNNQFTSQALRWVITGVKVVSVATNFSSIVADEYKKNFLAYIAQMGWGQTLQQRSSNVHYM